MTRLGHLFAFSVVMFIAPLLWAQDKDKAVSAQVQNQTQVQTFGGIGPTPWFAYPTIRQELKFNDEQFNQLNRNYQQN